MTVNSIPLQYIALFVTLFIGGWWTLTLRTRTIKRDVDYEMERQFWINHSVDLRYPVMNGSNPDINLIIRGVEVYENYWWLQIGDNVDRYPLSRPKEAYRMFVNRMRGLIAKGRYLLYRNLVPYASINTEVIVLAQTENCQIRMWESVEETDLGTLKQGQRVEEVLSAIESINCVRENIYRIHIKTDDYNKAAKAIDQLASSDYIYLSDDDRKQV